MRFFPPLKLTTALLSMSQTPSSDNNKSEDPKTTAPTTLKPLVLGGGLAGLAAALALKRVCPHVQVWEANDEVALDDTKAGAGAQLGPNGLRALQSICNSHENDDIIKRVLEAGTALQGNAMLMPDTDNVMVMPDTTQKDVVDGLPQVFLRWGVLRNILYQELVKDQKTDDSNECQVTIQTGCGANVAGYRILPDGYHLQLVDADGKDLPHEPCNLIVGAEGVASVMRYLVNTQQTIVPQDIHPLRKAGKQHIRDTGRINLKAVVAQDLQSLFDKTNLGDCIPGHTYAWFAPPKSGLGLACFCGPAGQGHSYWAISVADDAQTGKSVFDRNKNLHVEDIKLALLNLLKGAENCPPFILQAISDTDAARVRVSRSEESTGMGPDLVSADGRIVLVGDAAHAMSLSYGQNPNFALEDAAVLVKCLRQQQQQQRPQEADLMTALKAYSMSRLDRCVEMQRRSDERARKAMNGEAAEDVSKWIFQWDVENEVIVSSSCGTIATTKDAAALELEPTKASVAA